MATLRIDSAVVYPGPPAGAGRLWRRIWIVAVPVGHVPSDRAQTVAIELARLDADADAKETPRTLTAVGLSDGRSPFSLSADVPLEPGRYRLTLAGLDRPILFSFSGSPLKGSRHFCTHKTPHPSFRDSIAGFSGRGEHLGYHFEARVEPCCRKSVFAGFKGASNLRFLTVLLPMDRVYHAKEGSRLHVVKPGQYMVVDPDALSSPAETTPFPLHVRQVGVNTPILKTVLQALRLAADSPIGFSPEPRETTPALLATVDAAEAALHQAGSIAGEHGIRAALSALVFHLLATHPHRLAGAAPPDRPAKAPDARLKLATEYLRRHLDKPYSRLAVARAACTSDQHLRRLFQLHLHKSPHEILQELRVDEAKRLLADPETKLAEVARRVGYRDVRTFRRVFQRLTAQPSRAFRPAAAR